VYFFIEDTKITVGTDIERNIASDPSDEARQVGTNLFVPFGGKTPAGNA
jgi:hypothetical protein